MTDEKNPNGVKGGAPRCISRRAAIRIALGLGLGTMAVAASGGLLAKRAFADGTCGQQNPNGGVYVDLVCDPADASCGGGGGPNGTNWEDGQCGENGGTTPDGSCATQEASGGVNSDDNCGNGATPMHDMSCLGAQASGIPHHDAFCGTYNPNGTYNPDVTCGGNYPNGIPPDYACGHPIAGTNPVSYRPDTHGNGGQPIGGGGGQPVVVDPDDSCGLRIPGPEGNFYNDGDCSLPINGGPFNYKDNACGRPNVIPPGPDFSCGMAHPAGGVYNDGP